MRRQNLAFDQFMATCEGAEVPDLRAARVSLENRARWDRIAHYAAP